MANHQRNCERLQSLVSRFRSSQTLAAPHDANFGIKRDTSNSMILVPLLNPKFAAIRAARCVRTSGSRHQCIACL